MIDRYEGDYPDVFWVAFEEDGKITLEKWRVVERPGYAPAGLRMTVHNSLTDYTSGYVFSLDDPLDEIPFYFSLTAVESIAVVLDRLLKESDYQRQRLRALYNRIDSVRREHDSYRTRNG
jgi:hypothetical protein